ncbi:MAG: phytanoyl-CoA dioxygenase family protein [Alphaproteobacteria bacterium]|nr:phytanoyl-CoA dioxygenase family protein [Alphaproteobacteria bacterium]
MLTVAQLKDRDGWRTRAPDLHIGEDAVFRDVRAFRPDHQQAADLGARIKDEGYFQIRHDTGLDLSLMADTVRRFSDQGISPVFAFLFDEFWAPFHALDALYGSILGGYGMLPHCWVWNVDPQKGDAGWNPHRDMGHVSLRPDGSPIAITTWIPLSEANPLNSCMYMVPAHADPVYGTPRDSEKLFELPSIRALPAQPGDVLVWNQAVLHWGSRSSPRAEQSRVSMAFEFQRTDSPAFAQPIIPPDKPLPFEARLKLIARQVLQYRHMYRVDRHVEQLALELAG